MHTQSTCFLAISPAAAARSGKTWTTLAKGSACLFARGEKGTEGAAELRRVLHWRLSLKFCKCKSIFKTERESRRPSTSLLAPSVGWFTRCEATFGSSALVMVHTNRPSCCCSDSHFNGTIQTNEKATVICRWFRWARSVRSALVLVILLGCLLLFQSVFGILQIGKTCLRIL